MCVGLKQVWGLMVEGLLAQDGSGSVITESSVFSSHLVHRESSRARKRMCHCFVPVDVTVMFELIQAQRCREILPKWTEGSKRVKYQREIVKEGGGGIGICQELHKWIGDR